ncbi:MAG: leucyl/phenylalanyl-tRNA--protein transferase [Candidatus Nanopelagicales bacterium]
MASEKRELVGFSRGIDAGLMLEGYRKGIFAMSYWGLMYQWWAPDPRGVLPLDGLRVSRSLRKSASRYRVGYDEDFEEVLTLCADPERPGGWIDPGLQDAYRELHRLGHAHSVEARDYEGRLAGGLFVVNIGGFISGESMFHRARDASKVALVGLVERLRNREQPVLLDTQWRTEHLTSLGVVDVPRHLYLRRLEQVIDRPDVW